MNSLKSKFYVPNYLKNFAEKYWEDIENLSLKLSKYALFIEDKRGSNIYKPRIDTLGYAVKLNSNALDDYKKFCKLQELLWKSKLEEYKDELKKYGIGSPDEILDDLKLETKSRLVVGLGDESVYETSIRLHRNYGIPYIPGSALKGVAKHYAIYRLVDDNQDELSKTFDEVDFFKLAGIIQQKFEEPDDSKIESLKNLTFKLNDEEVSFEELRKIFGTLNQEGLIIFFDAFPVPSKLKDKSILELDIMNPHYQPYYSAKDDDLKNNVEKAPGDWHKPNPIFFLTVPEGIVFQFAIAPRDERGVCLLDKARDILISALEESGVGAKTALGYGRLREMNEDG